MKRSRILTIGSSKEYVPCLEFEAAALGLNVPFDDNEWDDSFHITGTPPYAPGEAPEAEVNVVTADYFRVMRMPLLRGRAFAAEDRASQPVRSSSTRAWRRNISLAKTHRPADR